MKNASAPAMPIIDSEKSFPLNLDWHGNDLEFGKFAIGLTKREMMAMHAPDNIPSWFEELWEKKNWNDDELYEDWVDEYDIDHRSITSAGSSRMYFEWRAHYADTLLAELERTNGR